MAAAVNTTFIQSIRAALDANDAHGVFVDIFVSCGA